MKNTKLKVKKRSDIGEGKSRISLSGRIPATFSISNIKLRSDVDKEESDSEGDGSDIFSPTLVFNEEGKIEERAKTGRPKKHYIIEGIASSTSIDHYGTEMSLSCLEGMKRQIARGVPILPNHLSQNSASGVGEWDEVIGRTVESDIEQGMVINPAVKGESQFTLNVRSVLYGEEPKTKSLMRRLSRGEPIGQSIGGWFEDVEVIEDDGEIERVIVRGVTLDHIAITRAPANPDSDKVSALSIRSHLAPIIKEMNEDINIRAKVVPFSKMPTAPPDTKWDWSTETENEVLGDDPNWTRFRKAHLYYDQETPEVKEAYKLPVARMFDGTLKVVLRGVQAAMAALNGARGGVKIDPKFREPIYRNIKKYYALFDEEAPPLRSISDLIDENSLEEIKMSEELKTDESTEVISEEQQEQNIVETKEETSDEEQRSVTTEPASDEAVNNKIEPPEKLDKSDGDMQNAVSDVTEVNSANTQSSGDTMTENDLAKIAELVQRAVAPLTERVVALEATPEQPKEEPKEEVRTEDSSELQTRLKNAETMIARLVQNPIRRGVHGVHFENTGVLAHDEFTRTAVAAKNNGALALSGVVSKYAEELAKEDEDSKMSKRDIINMLKQGLRAAAMDGLIVPPGASSSNWS